MMLTIAQLGISVFGVAAFLLVTRESRRLQIYGTIFGLISNPFWWLMVITTEQWLTIPVHAAYTYGWISKAIRLYNNRQDRNTKMIRQLSGNQKKHIQNNIRNVLDGRTTEWVAKNEYYPLMALDAAILEIDGVTLIDRDTNGWQWDYWQYYEFNGKTFTLSGSGYYGGHAFREKEQG